MTKAEANWERLVRAALQRYRGGADGLAHPVIGIAGNVPSSLHNLHIDELLRAADEVQDEDISISRILCEHAYSLAQNLDPNSEGRGMLQFKTGLMSFIKMKLAKRDGGSIDRSQDIARLQEFYKLYREKHKVDELHEDEMDLRESGVFSGNLGELERKTVERKKVFATIKVLGTVLEELTEERSERSLEELLQQSDDKGNLETRRLSHGTTSEGEGPKSSIRGQAYNEMPCIVMFSKYDIEGATDGLRDSSKIGQGGYGGVYKGYIGDAEVAIKMLDSNSKQGIYEFLQEMEVLGQMRHPNLVKLIGACVSLRALVYEFLPNGSLGDCLKKNPRLLTWQMRTRIIYEICSALTFLHSRKPPLVHGDLKPANILLNASFNSKLADFGLCRFLLEGTTTIAFLDTMPKGTLGYIDPEFMRTGILTPSCDLYSYGVTILRLLTGMEAVGISTKVRIAYKEKTLMTMVDPTAGNWPTDVAEFLAYFGLKCCAKKKSTDLITEIARDLEDILAYICD